MYRVILVSNGEETSYGPYSWFDAMVFYEKFNPYQVLPTYVTEEGKTKLEHDYKLTIRAGD